MSKEVLSQEFELLKQDLIEAYDRKGMRASGDWANSIETQIEENRAILLGLKYSQQLETGRKSGKQPPRQVIEDWIVNKGIAQRIQGQISISSLAYLIGRKIAREGWKREGFGGVGLISEIITDERLQRILDEVGGARLIAYSSEIIQLVRELETAA